MKRLNFFLRSNKTFTQNIKKLNFHLKVTVYRLNFKQLLQNHIVWKIQILFDIIDTQIIILVFMKSTQTF